MSDASAPVDIVTLLSGYILFMVGGPCHGTSSYTGCVPLSHGVDVEALF